MLIPPVQAAMVVSRIHIPMPGPLRGCVELVHDLHHQPGMRLFEGMRYRSPCHDRLLQQSAFGTVNSDALPRERRTTVLDDGSEALAALPWHDTHLDEPVACERRAGVPQEIPKRLGVDTSQRPLFERLFDNAPAPRRYVPPESGVRKHYFSHACLSIESGEATVLTDPFISWEYDTPLPRYTFCDLPERIDDVLITHGHSDHIRPEVLLRLRHRSSTIMVPRSAGRRLPDPSLKLMLQAQGFESVIELHEMESIQQAAEFLAHCHAGGIPAERLSAQKKILQPPRYPRGRHPPTPGMSGHLRSASDIPLCASLAPPPRCYATRPVQTTAAVPPGPSSFDPSRAG